MQTLSAPQQVLQPHRVWPAAHSDTHFPAASTWPQGQEIVLQVPLAQYSPVGQEPVLQMPLQPSLAPQALLEQVGAQMQDPLLHF